LSWYLSISPRDVEEMTPDEMSWYYDRISEKLKELGRLRS